jgi:glutamate dehydrogenase
MQARANAAPGDHEGELLNPPSRLLRLSGSRASTPCNVIGEQGFIGLFFAASAYTSLVRAVVPILREKVDAVMAEVGFPPGLAQQQGPGWGSSKPIPGRASFHRMCPLVTAAVATSDCRNAVGPSLFLRPDIYGALCPPWSTCPETATRPPRPYASCIEKGTPGHLSAESSDFERRA